MLDVVPTETERLTIIVDVDGPSITGKSALLFQTVRAIEGVLGKERVHIRNNGSGNDLAVLDHARRQGYELPDVDPGDLRFVSAEVHWSQPWR